MPVFIIDNSWYPVITCLIIALEAWMFVSTMSIGSSDYQLFSYPRSRHLKPSLLSVSHSVAIVVDLLHLPHKAAPDRHGVIPPPPPDGPAVACLPHTRRPHRTISRFHIRILEE